MTNAQIVALGVRLFAIWLALYLLRQAPGMWAWGARDMPDSKFAAVVVVVSLVLVVVTVVLWMFPLMVARKLLPTATLDQPTPLPIEQVERAGFCLLGLWLLTQAVPSLIYYGALLFFAGRSGPVVDLGPQYLADVTHAIVSFAIGVWLLFGAKGLLGLLRWARTAGTADKAGAP